MGFNLTPNHQLYFMSEYLKNAGKRDVRDVFDHCRELHRDYHVHNGNRGFTNDAGRTMRHVTSIPQWVLFSPEHKKYFDPKQDPHELKKNIDAWIKKNDWFRF